MKKAFTLVEMLIVVVVLVTLMTITFKLSSIGDDQTRRNKTVARMQRLENCLSGYYAAFGTYPPVKLHGLRDYNLQVNSHGMQQDTERKLSFSWYKSSGNRGIGTDAEYRDWKQVQAACLAQPVAARFPYPSGYADVIKARSDLAQERLASGEDTDTSAEHKAIVQAGYDDGYTKNIGRHDLDESDWRESQLFQFGLMSFLLPRYFVMMNGDEQFFTKGQQWIENTAQPCNPLTGERVSWSTLRNWVSEARQDNKLSLARVTMIPSQAACARWVPNLENSCYSTLEYRIFGVDIKDSDQRLTDTYSGVYSPGGSSGSSTSDQYVLSAVTMTDGWHHEFYYYSLPPYQSYTVWSAGKNGRTFPPWVSRKDLSSSENRCVGVWIEDDIIHMSN